MKIRPLHRELDKAMVSDWLDRDEAHKALGLTFKDVIEDGTQAYMVSDESGPLICVRVHRATRVAMQFNPDKAYRIAKVAPRVVEWMKSLAAEDGSKEVIIRPGGLARRFAEKLGFLDFVGKFVGVKNEGL